MPKLPTVSVICITYNQEAYIRQALDGFVSQKTNFAFEVIVADDCSKDNTQSIVMEYANNFPKVIKPILRKKNLGPQHNFYDALNKTTAKYIALCEGDDYWTDPTKLQRQVDFMESHPDHGLCFHPVTVHYENNEQPDTIFPDREQRRRFTVENLLGGNFIQTNSVLYRRQQYQDMPTNILPLDWYLHLFHAQFGKIGFIDRVMAVYRRHPGGIWWSSAEDMDKFWMKHGLAHIEFFNEIEELYTGNKQHKQVIEGTVFALLSKFVDTDVRCGSHIFLDILQRYPDLVKNLVHHQQIVIANQQAVLETKPKLEEEVERLREYESRLMEAQKKIRSIEASRSYKLATKLSHWKSRLSHTINRK